jgi:hypothetical protein
MRYAAHITLIFASLMVALVRVSTAHASEDQQAAALRAFVTADADAKTKQATAADKDAAEAQTPAEAAAALGALAQNIQAAKRDVDLQSFACVVLTKVPPTPDEKSTPDSDDYVLVAPAGIDSITYRSNSEGVRILVARGDPKAGQQIYAVKISNKVDFFTISLKFNPKYPAPEGCQGTTTPLTPPPPCLHPQQV